MHLLNFNLHEYFQKTLYFILIKQFLFWQKKKNQKQKQKTYLYKFMLQIVKCQGYKNISFKEPPS